MRTGGAWSSTNRGKWLTSFMLCAMSTCLMIMLSFFCCCCRCCCFYPACSVIVFYWVFWCACLGSRARASERARSFSLLPTIMFILRLLVHKLQWPSGNKTELQSAPCNLIILNFAPHFCVLARFFSIKYSFLQKVYFAN